MILCGELAQFSIKLVSRATIILRWELAQYDGPRRSVPELRHPGCYIMKAMNICFRVLCASHESSAVLR